MSKNIEIETPSSHGTFSFFAPNFKDFINNDITFGIEELFFSPSTSSATKGLPLFSPSKNYAVEKLTTKSPVKEPNKIKFLDNLDVKAGADNENEPPAVYVVKKAVNDTEQKRQFIKRFYMKENSDARKSPFVSLAELDNLDVKAGADKKNEPPAVYVVKKAVNDTEQDARKSPFVSLAEFDNLNVKAGADKKNEPPVVYVVKKAVNDTEQDARKSPFISLAELDNLDVKAGADKKNEPPVVYVVKKAVNDTEQKRQFIKRFYMKKNSDARKSPLDSLAELDNLNVKAGADKKNEPPVVNIVKKAVNEAIIKPTNTAKQVKNYLGRKSQGIQKRQPIKRLYTKKNSDAPFVSLAEGIQQFMERTPDRFKSKPVTMGPISNYVPTKTKSPFLRTKLRAERTRMKNKGNEINNDKVQSKPVDSSDINSERVKKTEPFKPSGLHGGLPPLPTTTAAKPFKLRTEIRGEKYQQYLREKITKLEKEEPFRARPAPNLVPYHPKKSDKPTTKVIEFNLRADARLEKRKVYDKQRNLREQEEKMRKQIEEEERNKQEIRQLRAELVHRAQPVKRYVPVEIEFANRKVTKPVSPLIGEKRCKKLQPLNEPNTTSENVSKEKIVPQSKNNNRNLLGKNEKENK